MTSWKPPYSHYDVTVTAMGSPGYGAIAAQSNHSTVSDTPKYHFHGQQYLHIYIYGHRPQMDLPFAILKNSIVIKHCKYQYIYTCKIYIYICIPLYIPSIPHILCHISYLLIVEACSVVISCLRTIPGAKSPLRNRWPIGPGAWWIYPPQNKWR